MQNTDTTIAAAINALHIEQENKAARLMIFRSCRSIDISPGFCLNLFS